MRMQIIQMLNHSDFPANQVERLKDIYYICLGIKSNNHRYLHPIKAYTTIGAQFFTAPRTKLFNAREGAASQ